MSDKVTPIRSNVQQGDLFKQQVTDTLAQLYDQLSDEHGKPVAFLLIGVTENGGANLMWHVDNKHEKQTSLYLARALQIAQIDLHEYQIHLNEGCPHG